jgi:hypothetical protein
MCNAKTFAEVIALKMRGKERLIFSKAVQVVKLSKIQGFSRQRQLVASEETVDKPSSDFGVLVAAEFAIQS